MFFRFAQISTCLLLLFSLFGCKTSPSAKLDFSDGSYEGGVNSKGEKDGTGIYRWIDGSIYDGDYSNDLRHGRGKFLWANGESYDGEYLKDNRTGEGIYSWPDGSSYQGEFLSGNRPLHLDNARFWRGAAVALPLEINQKGVWACLCNICVCVTKHQTEIYTT